MDIYSVIAAIISTVIAYVTSIVIVKFYKPQQGVNKFESIDGIRGFLAFFVFLHHCYIWQSFIKTGKWADPTSLLFLHLGKSSVLLFFMITGFLFWNKLRGTTRKIDWQQLYISRMFRLVPLYLFAMGILFFIVSILSDFNQEESSLTLVKQGFRWLTFTIMGAPDINNVADTRNIIASVTWSLVYEWVFYLSLPIFGFLIQKNVNYFFIVLNVAVIIYIAFNHHFLLFHFASFSGGIVASYAIENKKFKSFATKNYTSIIFIGLLIGGVCLYSYSKWIYLILISAAFCLLAAGNDIFGVLRTKASLMLGQMSYSIYLLHGMCLFVIFKFIMGFSTIKNINPRDYWLIVFSSIPILILLCHLTYYSIERTFMNINSNLLKKRKISKKKILSKDESIFV